MDKTPLIETNPYLKVPEKYREALIANVSSSTAIETGVLVESIAHALTEREKSKGSINHKVSLNDFGCKFPAEVDGRRTKLFKGDFG